MRVLMNKIYKKSDFTYNLPEELIARFPLPERSASRLLHVHPNTEDDVQLHDLQVQQFIDLLDGGFSWTCENTA